MVVLAYREAIFLSLRLHGGVEMACAGGHARAHAKSCKLGVYDSGGTSYLSCSSGSYVPVPVAGYVVACSPFYERGFGAHPHQFLHLLLQYYGFEQHHLTPLEVLHIAAFVTLCEAYIGIEPHFNLWNYVFRV
jgi:hypothetical protein